MATVYGKFEDSKRQALLFWPVTFTQRDALVVVGSRVIVPAPFTEATNGFGNLSVVLQPGVFQVDSGHAQFNIEVPDGDGVYDITNIGVRTFTYTPPPPGVPGEGRGTGANFSGVGDPEGVVAGRPGDLYVDLDPAQPQPRLFTKGPNSGIDTTTGWK